MIGSTRSYELGRRLVELGHEVHIVTTDRQAEAGSTSKWRHSIEAGIHVHWTPVSYVNDMSYRQRIQAFFVFAYRAAIKAASLGGDVVYATSTPLTIALPAVYATRRNRIPMVFEVRDLWPEVPIALGALSSPLTIGLARWLQKFAYRNSARIVALAPGMKQSIVDSGYPEGNVTVIPNGCDIDFFSGREESGSALRLSHDWLGSRPMVLYCGAIGLVNGVDYLVRLADRAREIDPEVRFVVIGKGRDAGSVREAARQAGVLGETLFFLGGLPKNDVADWHAAADMTIALISGPEILWRHATQNKFFDSLAAGRPIANNFNGWQAQVAESAGAGLILDPVDTDGAANTLVRHLRDEDWMRKAGSAGRELARIRFERGQHAAQLCDVLRHAIDEFDSGHVGTSGISG